jgi:hypothetical protein
LAFFGTLSTIPLPDLLQLLQGARKTGCLQVGRDRANTRLFFRDGHIVACGADDPPTLLGQFLIYNGFLSMDDLTRSLAEQEATGQALGAILVETGTLEREDLNRAVAAKARETLLGLFDQGSSVFVFRDGVEPGPSETRVGLDVRELLLEGMKRLDDLRRIRRAFPSTDLLLRRSRRDPPASVRDDPQLARTLEAVDGRRTIQEIIYLLHGTPFRVTEALFLLLREDLIAIAGQRPTSEPSGAVGPPLAEPAADRGEPGDFGESDLDRARRKLASGDPEGALEHLHRARLSNADDPRIRRLMAEAETAMVEKMSAEGLSPDKVPQRLLSRDAIGEALFSAEEEFLLNLVDGSLDIRSIAWIAPLRTVDVMTSLKRLLEAGILELHDAPATE